MNKILIPIGKVTKQHGLKGELKILVLSDFPDRFKDISCVYALKDEKTEKLTVAHCRNQKHLAFVKFEDIDTIARAKELIGYTLCIDENELHCLPQNSYYIHNLVGLTVFDESRKCIGKLKEVWQLPANDVFVVESIDKEMLFPVIEEAVKSISIEKKEIIVNSAFGVT